MQLFVAFYIAIQSNICKGVNTVLILGIETSCDETSAAVVEDGYKIISNIVASQEELHLQFGGVVPEIACRAHLESIMPVIDVAISRAKIGLNDLDAIAVANTPGLVGALLIGLTAAKALSWALSIPIVDINHLYAHIYSVNFAYENIQYPLLGLLASGGHTSLFFVKSLTDYIFLGGTLDDAAGEAFDKVAKVLGLGYPGGPKIDNISKNGDPNAIPFPRSYLAKDSLDFSFSGIKTAVLYCYHGYPRREQLQGLNLGIRDDKDHDNSQSSISNSKRVADIAASFQESVVEVLVNKTLYAFNNYPAKGIAIGGGVARNTRLREKFKEAAIDTGIPIYYPSPDLCTDNAAMIAGLAYHKCLKGAFSDLSLDAIPNFQP